MRQARDIANGLRKDGIAEEMIDAAHRRFGDELKWVRV